MTSAAIYARKSDDDAASVARQVEIAKDLIGASGWGLAEPHAHIYTDNSISGGVFDRPGLNALMEAIAQRPRPFDILVMMDASRLGRDMAETLPLQLKIIRAGIRIFHYQDGQELLLNTPVQKLVASVTNFSNEDYKYQIGVKTASALRKNVQKGGVGGGRLYGYDNVREGEFVRRVINSAEAEVVVRIFELYVKGLGIFGIAKTLNGESVKAPRAKGWSQGGIAGILRNETYIGKITYGRTERVITGGTKGTRPSQKPLVTLEREDLRIVSARLWRKVQAELAARSGPRGARRLRGRGSENGRYALSGFAVCAKCGGSVRITVRGSGHPPKRVNIPVYVCGTFESRGTCGNNTAVKAAVLEAAVVERIAMYLDSDIIGPAVDRALARLVEQRGPGADRRVHLEREVARLDQKGARLATAISETDALAPLVVELKNVENQKSVLQTEISALSDTAAPVDAGEVKRALAAYAKDVRALLAGTPEQARQVLRHLLRGRITMEPYKVGKVKGLKFSGELLINRLFGGTSLSVHSSP